MKSFFVRVFIFLTCFSFLLNGCISDQQEEAPDVSHIACNIEIERFDRDFFQIDTVNIQSSVETLEKKYPELFSLFFKNIIPLYSEDSIEFANNLIEYRNSPSTSKLYDTVFIEYPQLDDLETQFENAFKYYKYYFPTFITPNVYAVISDFGYQTFLFEDGEVDGIGIGLDMFLGATFPYKAIDPQNPSFSDYLTRSFNKDHILSKGIKMLLEDQVGPPSGVRLIDQMIHNGKKLYLLDKILPFEHDTIITEYSAEQLDWVRANQIQIWSYFTDENLLYETNMARITKYLRPAPSSPGMPPESPGMTANYIGWEIVKAFMKKYPETTIEELIQYEDSQQFLEQARYRPKNK